MFGIGLSELSIIFIMMLRFFVGPRLDLRCDLRF